jgi:hypothetical protein
VTAPAGTASSDAAPAPAGANPTGAIVRNFASSIWATLVGLLFAIIFMMVNSYLEPSFARLIEHRSSVRNVISHAKSQLGLALSGATGPTDDAAPRPITVDEATLTPGGRD